MGPTVLARSAVKAKASVVAKTMTAIEAFGAICLGCLDHLAANREGALAGTDPEYLHQMRVALRRLRSAFSVFSRLLPPVVTEPPLVEIRWLLRALGPARDWDVFFAMSLMPVLSLRPGHRGLIALGRVYTRRRGAARGVARRALTSPRYARLVPDLRAWLSGEAWNSLLSLESARALRRPAGDYAARALRRRYRQVRRRGRGLGRLAPLELHRLRIAVKKLRYTANFFATLFPARRVTLLRAPLEALQDALGGINDCATAARLIAEPRLRDPAVAEAKKLLASRNDAVLAAHRHRLIPAWKLLRAAERFWIA